MVGFKKSAPIVKWEKLDDGGLKFTSCFSSEAPDSQGDIVLQSATQKAVERWKAKNLREMHEPIAVGKAIDFDFLSNGTSWMTGFVTAGAPNTVKKMEDGVLQMMSIAGPPPTKTSRRTIDGKTYRVFEEYDLSEMSLVDNGSNPDAWISVTKAAGLDREGDEMPMTETAIEECAKAGIPPPFACTIEGHKDMTPAEHEKAHEEKPEEKAETPVETAIEAPPVEAPPPAEKAAPAPAVAKYDGMAAFDIRLALDCLANLEQLMALESGEVGQGKPEPPKQMKALQAACSALKEFVASEAQELLEPNGKAQSGIVVMKFEAPPALPAPPAPEIDLDALAAKVAALFPIQKSAPASEPDARIDTIQKTVGDLNAGFEKNVGEIKVIRDGIEKILAQPVPGRAPARNLVPPERMAKSAPSNDADVLRRLAASAPTYEARDWMLNEARAIEHG